MMLKLNVCRYLDILRIESYKKDLGYDYMEFGLILFSVVLNCYFHPLCTNNYNIHYENRLVQALANDTTEWL